MIDDITRERMIDRQRTLMMQAYDEGDEGAARLYNALMVKLIRQRSPEQVARMDRERMARARK